MKHIDVSDIQWVVEWWRITTMVNCIFKDNCVPLVGLKHCPYYSLDHITRQFRDRQGIPSADNFFHISVFIETVLGRICGTWLKRMVAKVICFPQFLHPTLGYKAWLKADMKWVHMDEKAYNRSKKRKKADSLSWYAPNFTFLHFMILMSFLLNLIKDWNVPIPLWKQFIIF